MNKNLKLQVILAATEKILGPLKSASKQTKILAAGAADSRRQIAALNKSQVQITGFRQTVQQARTAATAFTSARQNLTTLTRQMKAGGGGPELARKIAQARAEVSRLATAKDKALASMRSSKAALDAAGISTKRLADTERQLKSQTAAATTTLEAQRSKLKALETQQRRMDRARSSYQGAMAMRSQIAGTGVGMMAAGGGALYAAKRMMMPGFEFDAGMSKVQALTRLDKDSAEYKMLREQARELGAATSFTANDAAQGQAFLAMAGFTPQAIKAAMPGMLDLARAGDLDLGRTSDIASNILSGFKLPADQMDRLADTLVGTFTRSNVTMEMLGEAMSYVAPVSASLGVSLEETAAMAGKLGDAGIQGGRGGTALRAIMLRMASPPKMAADAMASLGVEVKDAYGNLRPMADILTELHDKTKDLGDVERAEKLRRIAGMEAASAMNILVEQAGSGELQTFIKTLRESGGEAAAVSKTMADNLKGDLKGMESAWEDLGIQIFDVNDGAFREVAQSVTGIIRDIGAWAKDNKDLVITISRVALYTAALVTVLGGLALSAAAVLGPFATLKFASSMLGIKFLPLLGQGLGIAATAFRLLTVAMMANPIGAVVGIIALAAGLIIYHWDEVKVFFESVWEEIKTAFDGGLTGILGLIANWSPIGVFYRAFAAVMSYLGIDLPSTLTELGGAIWQGLVDGLTDRIDLVRSTIVNAASGIADWFKEALGINSPSRVFMTFGGFIMDGLVAGIGNALGAVKDAIVNAGASVTGWFKETLGIHSPSRVFTELGGNTMEGLAIGLDRGSASPLATVNDIARKVATTGMALSVAAMPALGAPALDTRPPLAPRGGDGSNGGGVHYHITINPSPGMDEEALGRLVVQKLEEFERRKVARERSRLTDRD